MSHTFKTAAEAKQYDRYAHIECGNNLHLLPIICAMIDREIAEDREDLRIYRQGLGADTRRPSMPVRLTI